MKIEKHLIQACCGRTSIIYKTGSPITESVLEQLKTEGFTIAEHFKKAGILYADNKDFILTGPIGTNRLQVKCKTKNCDNIADLEVLLDKIG